MTTITEYLSQNISGILTPFAGVWVRLNNNATFVNYVSTAATDVNGLFTVNNVPAGTYTVFTGPTSNSTPNATGDTSFTVELVDGAGNAVIPGTLTVVGSSALSGGFTMPTAVIGKLGTGDEIAFAAASNLSPPQLLEAVLGTAAAPYTTVGPVVKINKTEQLLESQLVNGATNEQNAGLAIMATNTALSEVQNTGISVTAQSKSTQSAHNDDAAGILSTGRIIGSGTGYGIGGYFDGRRDTNTGHTNGIEVRSANYGTVDGSFNPSGASDTMGVWITSGGTSTGGGAANGGVLSGVALSMFGLNNTQWSVGLGIPAGSVKNQSFYDNSSSATSILIKGTHATAGIAIDNGAGPLVIGELTPASNTSLLEVMDSNADHDPLVQLGGVSNNHNYSARLRNASGTVYFAFISGSSNTFLTGTVAGDTGTKVLTSGKSWHVGGTASALKVGQDNSVTFTSNPTFNGGLTLPASQLATIGTGDLVNALTSSIAGRLVDIRLGTAASPDTTDGSPIHISRVINLTAGTETGDGYYAGNGIQVDISNVATDVVQPLAIVGNAKTIATAATVAGLKGDAGGGYFTGWSSGASTHLGIGAFAAGRNDSSAGGAQANLHAIELAAENRTATDATVSVTGSSGGGIWITAGNSFNKVGAAIEIWNSGIGGQGAKAGLFDVGLHFSGGTNNSIVGPIDTASIQDDSTAATSILINGTHATAALAIKSGAGPLLVNEIAVMNAGALFEVKGPTSTQDPLVYFGNTGSLQAYGVRVGNNTGSMDMWVAAGSNNFITGSIAGDVGIKPTAVNKFVHIGGSATAIRVGNDNTIQFMASTATPVGGSAAASFGFGSGPGPGVFFGSGAPTVSAPKGSIYLRTDGTTTNDRAFINTNGTTTWTALTTVA